MKKSDKLRRWAIEKLGGYTQSVVPPPSFGIIERTNRYDFVPLRVSVAIRDEMMSVKEYAYTKDHLVSQAKRQLVEAAEPFFEIEENLKEGIIFITMNVLEKQR